MSKPSQADRKPPARKRCPKCGAVKMQKLCIRCHSAPIDKAAARAQYLLLLAKHRVEMEMRKHRAPIWDGRLRGQPDASHRRGGIPYNKHDVEDDYNRSKHD
jgi:hypothetical protein